jgi:hypothetical protein
MEVQKTVPTAKADEASSPVNPDAFCSTRDRLLNVLNDMARLSNEDAAAMDRIIQKARESSIADELSARY